MQTLNSESKTSQSNADISAAIQEAITAEDNFNNAELSKRFRIIVAGQMIQEKLQEISLISQTKSFGNSFRNDSFDAKPDLTFKEWLTSINQLQSERTIRNWMSAATALMRRCHVNGEIPTVKYYESGECLISEILKRDDEDCTPLMLKFKEEVISNLKHFSLTDLIRSGNGKTSPNAGGGGDRKNFEAFTRRALQKMTNFLTAGKPRQFRKLEPDQIAEMISAFTHEIKKWPREYLEAIKPAIAEELKLDEYQREHRAGK